MISGDQDRRLFDRERELAVLQEAFAAAREGRGTTIALEGAAGSGKSALLSHARSVAATLGLTELRASGGELEREFPFGVTRQLLEPVLAASDGSGRRELLAGSAAPAGAILGMAGAQSGRHAAGFAAMHAIYGLTVRVATRGPLLVLVDDAHWADASSLRALDYLARRIGELPVALLLAFRPDEPGAHAAVLDGLRTEAGRRLSLSALRPASVTRLVRERFPEAPDGVCLAWHETCAGNPLYVRELLRTFAHRDAPPQPDAVRQAAVRSLGDRVLRRAERVAPEAPALTRAMAVLGDGARLDAAAALAGVAPAVAGEIAHDLRRIEVLEREDPVAFVHPLIRRSVYDAIPARERQAMHRDAAQWLERAGGTPEAVAAHLRVLPPSADPAAARAFLRSAERALDGAAPDEAAGWLIRALEEGAAEPSRGDLLGRLGTTRALQRDLSAVGLLQEAHAITHDPRARGRLALTLADILSQAGLWGETRAMVQAAADDVTDGDLTLAAEVAAMQAAISLFDPAHTPEFELHREHYVALSEGGSWAAHAIAALLAAEASHRGRPAQALRFAARARHGGRLFAERGAGAWASPQLLGALVAAEDLDGALTVVDELEVAAERSGSVIARVTAMAFRGWAHARRGDLRAAEADITTAFALAADAGMLMAITTGAYLMIDVLLEREVPVHLVTLIETTELGPEFMSTTSGAMLGEARGLLAVRAGDRERAVAQLRAAGEIYSALRFGPAASSWRSSLALALPPSDRGEARRLAADELELARAIGLSRYEGIALRTCGMLADGHAQIELLQQSAAMLEDSPAGLEHARSLVELGAALRRANRRADARPPLLAGIELAHRCGADRLTARARQELQAAGGRRPRIVATGRDALTASELRIVQLAADGVTNVEIGQRLFISLKTVETHLYRAYGKLGLAGAGSRGRLADALARSADPDGRSAA